MATVTVASSNPSFSHTFFTLDDKLPGPDRPREASFSSYLSAADESFSLGLTREFNDLHNTTCVQVTLGSGRKKKAADQGDELDVFGAEKYFNGGMDCDKVEVESEKTCKVSPLREAELTGRRTLPPGTPSSCSGASGNSRSVLLRDPRSDRSRIFQRPHSGSKKFLGIFPCSCSDGSSVEVDNSSKERNDGGIKLVNRSLGQARPELCRNDETLWRRADRPGGVGFTNKKEDCSFSPVLNPVVVGNSTVGMKAFQEDPKMARIPPVDVFGSLFLAKEEVASSLRRSLTIMSPFNPGSRGGGVTVARDDDAGSESSSDLFEIESLSTGTMPLGGAGGTSASTTCYEPSEASIEWSVVTASAANFSVASDGEVSPPKARKVDGRPYHQRPGGGLLLGCGSAKAVNVVSNTYRVQEKAAEVAEQRQRHKSMDTIILPEIRYHAERPRSVDLERGRAGHVLAARVIPRPSRPRPGSPGDPTSWHPR